MEEVLRILKNQEKPDKKTQYHPAFVCGLQMTLHAFRSGLVYEPEHPLSQKPQFIDVLVIKKDPKFKISAHIAEQFRAHTVIEYK